MRTLFAATNDKTRPKSLSSFVLAPCQLFEVLISSWYSSGLRSLIDAWQMLIGTFLAETLEAIEVSLSMFTGGCETKRGQIAPDL